MAVSENDVKKTNSRVAVISTAIFNRRRSSVHLEEAQTDLDLRANTLIGFSKDKIEKLVNFDREYFKQLSKSPTGKLSSPVLNGSDLTNRYSLPQDSSGVKLTTYFIDDHTSGSNINSTMDLRRAYSNLRKGSLNMADTNNIYQQLKRSKTDIPEIYTDRRLNLPPVSREPKEPMSRKRLKFGNLRAFQKPPVIEHLPPIQMSRISSTNAEITESIIKERSNNQTEEAELDEGNQAGNGQVQKLVALRYNNGKTAHAILGELKLHANQTEFDELIEKSKNPKLMAKSRPDLRRRSKTTNDLGFVIASTSTTDSVKELKSNFEIRKEYGKNLEKNWFKNFLQQSKAKKGDPAGKFDLDLEQFYSPEPSTRDGSVISDVDSKCDENMDNSEDENNKISEMKQFKRKKHLLDISGLFSSTDVLTGEDYELDRDTASEIEFVLTDNELIQKKTKHKMRKKRRRKEKRRQLLSSENDKDVIPQMTDKELRAIRLNIKKKKPPPVLTGKRKFLQVANAVFVAVQFQKILMSVRDKNRKRRQSKLKKKIRRVKWRAPLNDYSQFERPPATPPTLGEKFMKEVGNDLLKDLNKLDVKYNSEESEEPEISDLQDGIKNTRKPSKYELEASKACIEDVENYLSNHNRTLRKFNRLRRHSAPMLSIPEGLLIEVSDKPKGKRRNRSKSVRRVKSAKKKQEKRNRSPNLAPKCSCGHKHAADRKTSVASLSQSTICIHKEEPKVPEKKYVVFHRSQVLKRRPSLNEEELKKQTKGVDLEELLRDVNIPAKDIKIQIIQRKMRKQKRKKEAAMINIYQPPVEESEDTETEIESSSEPETDESFSDYEFNTNFSNPFVSSGVAWNQGTPKRTTWTSADVDRELKRVTRFFLEMKDCSYIRFTGINQAIVSKLDEIIT